MENEPYVPYELERRKSLEFDPNAVLREVLNEYKGLSKIHTPDNTAVVFSTPERSKKSEELYGPVYLEYWPIEESGVEGFPHPMPGKNVLEIYDEGLKTNPHSLKQALFGDLIHGMNKDEYFNGMREEFMQNFTNQEIERIDKRQTWWEDINRRSDNPSPAIYDAYIRGWLGSDSEETKRGQARYGNTMYSEKQLELLNKMQNYLRTGE